MTRGIQVTFDAADPHHLAAWWAELLQYYVEDSHDMVSQLLADGVVGDDDVVEILAARAQALHLDQAGARDDGEVSVLPLDALPPGPHGFERLRHEQEVDAEQIA